MDMISIINTSTVVTKNRLIVCSRHVHNFIHYNMYVSVVWCLFTIYPAKSSILLKRLCVEAMITSSPVLMKGQVSVSLDTVMHTHFIASCSTPLILFDTILPFSNVITVSSPSLIVLK